MSEAVAPEDLDRTIANKLRAARAAHLSYQYAKRDNPGQAKTEMLLAQRLRQEAEAIDPGHTATVAWQQDSLTHPHQDLLAFYDKELAK